MMNQIPIGGQVMKDTDWQAIMDSKSYTLEEVKAMLKKRGVVIENEDDENEDYEDNDDHTFYEIFENSYIEEGLE